MIPYGNDIFLPYKYRCVNPTGENGEVWHQEVINSESCTRLIKLITVSLLYSTHGMAFELCLALN